MGIMGRIVFCFWWGEMFCLFVCLFCSVNIVRLGWLANTLQLAVVLNGHFTGISKVSENLMFGLVARVFPPP